MIVTDAACCDDDDDRVNDDDTRIVYGGRPAHGLIIIISIILIAVISIVIKSTSSQRISPLSLSPPGDVLKTTVQHGPSQIKTIIKNKKKARKEHRNIKQTKVMKATNQEKTPKIDH